MQKYKIMNIKTLFLVCFLLTFFNIVTFGQAKDKVSKIVIDAGHGGTMPGAIGKLCKEKDLNLKVANRLGKLISDNFDDVTVIYTRKGDETVDLYKRAEIANKNKADLFISIHSNAVDNKNVTGVETFVMGLGKTAESVAIAKKENADMLLEKDYETNYSGFDPNSPEAYIVFSLYSSAYLNWSTILASKVQKHLVTNTKMTDRTVQQAGFFVLYKVAMPSILIELGFISNAEEEKFLLREDAQELLAVSIYNAFVEYKNLIEGTLKPYLPIPAVKKNIPVTKPVETTVTENVPVVENKNEEIKVPTDTNPPELPEVSETKLPADTTVQIAPAQPATSEVVRFRIQFFITKENLNTSDKKFNAINEVKKYLENGIWKYTSGDFKTLDDAQVMLKEVRKHFSDAFIIAFRNENKISIQEAQALIK
jgi:N-acetylmuramoyl-L-alanine amidase